MQENLHPVRMSLLLFVVFILLDRELKDHGTGSPFGEGEASGCSLPDSIIVGRIASMSPGLVGRELVGRDPLVSSRRASLLCGRGVSDATGLGVEAASESDSVGLLVGEEPGLFSRSAASAPADRICSSVGAADVVFLTRGLGLVRSGAAVFEGVCSGGGAVCLGASGFGSRLTITSCAYAWPTRMRLRNSTFKTPPGTKRRPE